MGFRGLREESQPAGDSADGVEDLLKTAHRAVASVAEDIDGLRFNRAVAQIYELANALGKFQQALESDYSTPCSPPSTTPSPATSSSSPR